MNARQWVAGAALVFAGACGPVPDTRPAPAAGPDLILPLVGQSREAVQAVSGAPERREQVNGRELWVYSQIVPRGTALVTRTATVWFQEGVVVESALAERRFTPNPTFPPNRPVPPATGDSAAGSTAAPR